jgi:hypothetical protein
VFLIGNSYSGGSIIILLGNQILLQAKREEKSYVYGIALASGVMTIESSFSGSLIGVCITKIENIVHFSLERSLVVNKYKNKMNQHSNETRFQLRSIIGMSIHNGVLAEGYWGKEFHKQEKKGS